MKSKIISCLFFNLFFLNLFAQDNCITFSGLEVGTYNLEVGEILLEENGAVVRLDSFIRANGTGDYRDITITDAGFFNNFNDGNWAISNYTNLVINFYEDGEELPNEAQIDIYDGGGESNFSVNGQPILRVQNWYDLPSRYEGIDIEVVPLDSLNTAHLRLFLKGDLENILIGGLELGIDNICFKDIPEEENLCSFSNVVAEAHTCDENGQFLVDIAFDAENVGESFQIFGHGSFEYGQGFYTIGPLNGDGETYYSFVIDDNDNNLCQGYVELGIVDCTPPIDSAACQIQDLDLRDICLNPDGTANAIVDFDYVNPENDFFDLFVNDEFAGFFPLSELPLRIENQVLVDSFLIIKVCINDNPDCCQEGAWVVDEQCRNPDECHISNVFAEAHTCDENGQFLIDIEFEATNTGENFEIRGNGHSYGIFDYGQPFYTVGPLEGDENLALEFIIIDQQNEGCQAFTTLSPVSCDSIGTDTTCFVSDLEVYNMECQGSAYFSATLDFYHQDAGNDFFDLYYQNNFLGFYTLASLPIHIDSIPFDLTDSTVVFSICINDNPACCTDYEILFEEEIFDCLGNNVWAGDINRDHIVNLQDLLYLGIAFNSTGFPRANASLEWRPQYAPFWDNFFPQGLAYNYSHADTNGDGIVDAFDIEGIVANYGKTNDAIEPIDSIEVTENDPALAFNLPPDDEIAVGVPLFVPITLGTADIPVEDIYGLSFTLEFNPEVINPSTIEIEYPASWLGQPDVNLLSLDRTLATEGKILIAMTRNDQNNVSGFGEIARFIGMIDDILGYEVQVNITDIVATDVDGDLLPINTIRKTTATKKIDSHLEVSIFPNPVTNKFKILANQLIVEQVNIYTITGILIKTTTTQEVTMADLQSGIYLIEIQTDRGIIFKKVVKE